MSQRTERIKSLSSMSWFRIGALLVQPDRLVIIIDGREIALEPRMMEVLVALGEHAGEVVSAEQLLIEVWQGTFYGDNPVHKAIAHLRRLVGDDSRAPRYIETIRKRGYRLIAKVSFPDDYRRGAVQTTAWSDRSPYVGLSAFDSDHSGVFFGRSRMTAELLTAIRRQIDSQRRFVLIVGASGCGKTSLLRAGVVPLLQQAGGFDGLHALSMASCDLAGAHGGDVLTHLASSLAKWTIGERPVFALQSPAELAQALVQRPASIAEAIEDAIRRHPSRAITGQPHAHLLLVLDHAESLVAAPNIGGDERTEFARVLEALCETPRAMVVMIARSDFYPKLIEAMPELIERKGSDGHVDVLTPRPGEIAQIIRTPALLAGLTFEEETQTLSRLDDVLRDAATVHLDALPLLQHTLQALYERRDEAGELSFQAYRDIGGLEGALTHRAEAVFAALPADAQRSLDRVLSQLIVIQPDSDSISTRRVLWSALAGDGARALVEAFIRGRLFIGELDDGRPAFGVAHESLLRQWPRARDWAQDNRRLLQARTRLQRAAARWVEEGRRNDHLLNPGRPLSEALEAAQRLPEDLDSDERELLRASQHQSRRRQLLRAGAVVALAIFAGVSAVLAVFAQRARDDAEQRQEEALQLSDFMLVDLAGKLRPLGNLKLLDSISAKALSQLERRSEAQMGVEDLVNRSRALRTFGEVLMEQAKLKEAESAFMRADAAARTALARAPDAADAIAESGIAAYWLGYYRYRQRQLDDARGHWTTYLQTSERLLRLEPYNPAWQVELSYALNNLGTIARDLGHIDEAIAYFRRSAVLKRSVLSKKPNDDALRYELIDTLSWISSGDESQGRLAEAAAGYVEQISMLRLLITGNSGARAWERRLAHLLLRSAMLATARGQLDEAYTQIDESIARLSKLTAQEPDNRVWIRDLAHAQMEAGEIARMRYEPGTQSAHLEKARALAHTVVADGKQLPEWQRLDALIRFRIACTQTVTGSDAAMDEAIADLRGLAEQAPDDVASIAALTNALVFRGEKKKLAGLSAEATEDALEVIARLQSTAPQSKDIKVLAPWVAAHALIGRLESVSAEASRLRSSGYKNQATESLKK